MNRVALLCSTTLLTAGLSVVTAAPAAADDTTCRGTIRAQHVDGDVVVPRGATCRLLGTSVDGNVKVYRNAVLKARGVRVGGNVQADNFKRVVVTPRTTDDRVVRPRVDGSIQVKQGGSGVVRRAIVGSDVQVFTNEGLWRINRNVIDGNLQCKSNDPKPTGDGNRVGGTEEDQCKGF